MPELEKVKCSTPDFAKENAKKLLALFPECEGQKGEVDIDKLRQVLSSTAIEGNVERYEFTWPGKRAAKAAASARTTKTLRPCAAESVGKDGTPGGFDSENLYIEGDNLEVLKLLQTSYANQVKMIYIDPPYNTGHDFVYRDRFSLTQKELDDNAGVFDEDGNRFEVNDSAEARYHSNWCSMMYPRLKLARNLLRDDGVIFISIDDNEIINLTRLCEEIFGPSNVETCVWQKVSDDSGKLKVTYRVRLEHEYVVICYKNKDQTFFNKFLEDRDYKNEYTNPDNDPRGPYKQAIISDTEENSNQASEDYYSITSPSGKVFTRKWRVHKWEMDELIADGRIYFGINGDAVPSLKAFINEPKLSTPSSIFREVGTAKTAGNEIEALFEKKVFSYPKPTDLLLRILRIVTDHRYSLDPKLKSERYVFYPGVSMSNITQKSQDIILDFFSGSATTAHAMMELNAEDNGNRKFIMVQLPEVIDPGKASGDAKKTAQAAVELLDSIGKPHVICEIAKERIRRAGKKISEDNTTTAPNLDIGFRGFKLDTSSLRDTSATVSETNQEFANFERIKSDRSPEDLLFQVLLETRIQLSEPIVKTKVAGNEVLFVGCDGEGDAATSGAPLAACLDAKAKMTTDFFIEIAKLKPGIAFFRDDAFADDSARTNLQQVFNQFSPTTSIKVI